MQPLGFIKSQETDDPEADFERWLIPETPPGMLFFIPETQNEINSDAIKAHLEEVLLRNYLLGIVELKWLSNLRLPQNGGAVLLSNGGNPSFLFFFLFLQQWMCSISGSNYWQGAFQEGSNLSFHLQVIRDKLQVVVGGVHGRDVQQVC